MWRFGSTNLRTIFESRWTGDWYCCRITWQFVPPTPKELIPVRRGLDRFRFSIFKQLETWIYEQFFRTIVWIYYLSTTRPILVDKWKDGTDTLIGIVWFSFGFNFECWIPEIKSLQTNSWRDSVCVVGSIILNWRERTRIK